MPSPKKRRSTAGRARPALREHLAALLDWGSAHVGFDAAVAGVPAELRGRRAPGVPHSLWELLEHLRRCQWDILDYCVNPNYREPASFEEYWPGSAEPPEPRAWENSVAAFRRDMAALKRLANDPKIDLTGPLPYAPRHTYLRELLLVADHNAYHIGQVIQLRRLLGIWPAT